MKVRSITIESWAHDAVKQLHLGGIPSARLDAELILAHTLNTQRTFLHAHPEMKLDEKTLLRADEHLSRRRRRVPLAYILGRKDFFGHTFAVSPATLVPRPESEDMISLFLEHDDSQTPKTLIDIGTGSGCLGISAALARPQHSVILSDISTAALEIAQKNAHNLHAKNVSFLHGSLLDNAPKNLDIIFANLPYVDPEWTDTSPEIAHEPASALYAGNHGLALIFELLDQAPQHLRDHGSIYLEADPTQHRDIILAAKKQNLRLEATRGYILLLRLETRERGFKF